MRFLGAWKMGALWVLAFQAMLVCLVCGSAFAASDGQGQDGVNLSYPYVITLESSVTPFDSSVKRRLKSFAAYRLYTTTAKLDGKLWHRLRLGFFPNKKAASAAQKKIKKSFPGAWIAKAPESERKLSEKTAIVKGTPAQPKSSPLSPEASVTAPAGQAESKLTQLFKQTGKTIGGLFKKKDAPKSEAPKPETQREETASAKEVVPISRIKTNLRVRSRPNTDSRVVGILRPLETASFIRSVPGWHEVKLDNGRIGFVSQAWSQVRSAESASQLTAMLKSAKEAIAKAFQQKPSEKPVEKQPKGADPRVAQLKQQTLEEVRKTLEQQPMDVADKKAPDTVVEEQVVPIDRVKNHINVRKSPNASSTIVGKLRPSEAALLVRKQPSWYQVTLSDGTAGFVSQAWTKLLPVTAEAKKASLIQNALKAVSDVFKSAESKDESPVQSDFRLVQLMRKSQQAVTEVIREEAGEKAAAQPSTRVDDQAAELMEQARKAMSAGDYSRAVSLYTAVLQIPDHKDRANAQEFLALARERMGQFAHAKAEYEKYLKLYPEGEGAQRVSQRLAGLLTMATPAKAKLAKTEKKKRKSSWNFYGSFSQFQRVDASQFKVGNTDLTLNQSELATDLTMIGRFRSSDFDIRTQFVGGYDVDFLRSNNNDLRISSMFVDVKNHKLGLSTRIGRQTRSSGGVLGRFDGGLVSYQVTPQSRVNLVAGFPVYSSSDTEIRTRNYFYGAQVELGPFFEEWNFSVFGIQQEIENILDRRAVGGEVRYISRNRSLVALVDYDILYNALNTFMVLGHWTLPDKSTFNIMFDNRKSPILTATNALQGQPVTTIEELLATLSEDEIHALAKDRAPESRLVSIGYSRPLTEKLQIGADVTVSTISGTPASGGVPAVQGLGNDYFASLQFISSGLTTERGTEILSLRYSNTSFGDIWGGSLNARYPIGQAWLVNPRVLLERRAFSQTDGEELSATPSLRLSYVFRKRYHFDLDGSARWYRITQSGSSETALDYFMNAGYRIDF